MEPRVVLVSEKDQLQILRRTITQIRDSLNTMDEELESKQYCCPRCHKKMRNKKSALTHIAKCME